MNRRFSVMDFVTGAAGVGAFAALQVLQAATEEDVVRPEGCQVREKELTMVTDPRTVSMTSPLTSPLGRAWPSSGRKPAGMSAAARSKQDSDAQPT